MAKAGNARKQRIPKLCFTESRGVGWHVSFRDPDTGIPKKHRFGVRDRADEPEALRRYHRWVSEYLGNSSEEEPLVPERTSTKTSNRGVRARSQTQEALSGSLLEVANGLLDAEESRVRAEGDPRRRGSISGALFRDRRKQLRDFLIFLNTRHGAGAVGRMRLEDLRMRDVEEYNRSLVEARLSASLVTKRMQIVKSLIDRAGRPEHGHQQLPWNWNSRDVAHGEPARERQLPTVTQLESLLAHADVRGQAMIWLGMGLGFGPRDLASVRVGQIARDAYDLRREKTGVDRYGATPPCVWAHLERYQADSGRPSGSLLFVTRTGRPVVHGATNTIATWWRQLKIQTGLQDTVDGFYVLRHLGATEHGSRPGASIGNVKRWLGHATSSQVADVYMRPVAPEHRLVIDWLRSHLDASSTK